MNTYLIIAQSLDLTPAIPKIIQANTPREAIKAFNQEFTEDPDEYYYAIYQINPDNSLKEIFIQIWE